MVAGILVRDNLNLPVLIKLRDRDVDVSFGGDKGEERRWVQNMERMMNPVGDSEK